MHPDTILTSSFACWSSIIFYAMNYLAIESFYCPSERFTEATKKSLYGIVHISRSQPVPASTIVESRAQYFLAQTTQMSEVKEF
jgi:hypothetical protein